MTALWVALAGGLGCVSRYWIGIAAERHLGSRLGWATLIVNVLGSIAIGFAFAFFAARGEVDSRTRIAVTTGFLGGFTTYSAFALESFELLEKRSTTTFLIYVGLMLVCAILGCAAGVLLGRAAFR